MNLFPRRRTQQDFSAELDSHIAIEAERLRQEGLSAAEAERSARRAFGNVSRAEERFYESRRILWLEDLVKDLRFATRTLRQAPAFALTVIVTLALGIGATAAIFSMVDAALIRPLPYPGANRIVTVYERWQGDLDDIAPADFLDYRRQSTSFENLAGVRDESFNVSGDNRPERVLGDIVTPNFFSVFGTPAQLGRTLDAAQDQPGHTGTAVIAYSLWKRRYGGSPDVLGQTILLDGEPHVIVGVMPPSFRYPGASEIWVPARFKVPEHPLRPFVDATQLRSSHYFDTIGRLRAGVSIGQAKAELTVIAERLRRQYKDEEAGDGLVVQSLRDDLVGSNTRPAILILLGAVAVLFLIACANVANIVLARSGTRQKEIAIRGSLGAGRLRLIRQLFVESLVLALSGAAVGVLAANYALRSLETLIPAELVPLGGLHIDARLIAFAIAVSVVSTILFGLFPALEATRADLRDSLNESGRSSTSGVHAHRKRSILVATQIALAAVLLTSAGLLIRSLDRLLSAPTGFRPDQVMTLRLSLPDAQYHAPADRNRFVTAVLDKIRALPGVRSAGIVSHLPLTNGQSSRGVQIKGRTAPPSGDLSPEYLVVTPDYFSTLGISVLEGRVFSDRDDPNTPGVVINAAMAHYFWPGQDPVGKLMKIDEPKDWSPVIGVVADVAQQKLDRKRRPAVYVRYAQDPWPALGIVIRTAMDPKTIANAATEAIHAIDKDEPVYDIRTMHEVIARSLSARRFRTTLLALFASLALCLAGVGIYGVMAYSVAQRSNEFGIRLAVGAQPNKLRLSILGEALRLAVYGIAAGLLVSLALSRILSGVLFGIGSADLPTFAAAFCFLMLGALLASYLPAHRATRIDPAAIFRMQ